MGNGTGIAVAILLGNGSASGTLPVSAHSDDMGTKKRSVGLVRRRSRAGGWLSDAASFEALYASNAPTLWRFFARRTYESQIAMDLTAETFARAFADRAKFRGTTDLDATNWLFGIARHLFNGYLRTGYAERDLVRRLGVLVPVVGDENERVRELIDARRLEPVLAQYLGSLTAEQREAVQLRVVEELPVSAVAEALGISPKAVRMRVARGLERLANEIETRNPTLLEAS